MILRGFNPPGGFELPPWAGTLKSHYWRIRVEGRDKAKRLRFYRLVRKEKLRLVESGLSCELVDAVCRYLVRLNGKAGLKVEQLIADGDPQMRLNFFDD